jgi:hypothetical protein
MSAEKELIVAPPQETALAVYSAPKGLEPWLQKIRVEVDAFNATLPELNTVKGRKLYASMAYKIAQTKTALEKVGMALSAEQKEVPKRIDAERKRVWDILESWQAEVRKPLDDWQAAEDARIDRHQDQIQWLEGLANVETLFALGIRDKIERVESFIVDEGFEEFEADALKAKAKTLEFLRAALTRQETYEAEQAELERLREEAAARAKADHEAAIARAASEKAQREADERAAAELAAAAKREQDLKDQAAAQQRASELAAKEAAAKAEYDRIQLQVKAEEAVRAAAQAEADRHAAIQKAEQDRIAAEKRQAAAVEQARLAEIARQEAEAAEVARQQAAREADQAHKIKVMGAAKEALIGMNISEELAKAIILKICRREVPHVTINF